MNELRDALENEQQKLMDTNRIGFYISVNGGSPFTSNTLLKLFDYYRNTFRNSVIIVYDLSKAQYGLNPLQGYRLS